MKNQMKAIKAIRANVRSLRRAALRQYLDGAFNYKASDYFLRRLREAEQVGKIATRMVIGL